MSCCLSDKSSSDTDDVSSCESCDSSVIAREEARAHDEQAALAAQRMMYRRASFRFTSVSAAREAADAVGAQGEQVSRASAYLTIPSASSASAVIPNGRLDITSALAHPRNATPVTSPTTATDAAPRAAAAGEGRESTTAIIVSACLKKGGPPSKDDIALGLVLQSIRQRNALSKLALLPDPRQALQAYAARSTAQLATQLAAAALSVFFAVRLRRRSGLATLHERRMRHLARVAAWRTEQDAILGQPIPGATRRSTHLRSSKEHRRLKELLTTAIEESDRRKLDARMGKPMHRTEHRAVEGEQTTGEQEPRQRMDHLGKYLPLRNNDYTLRRSTEAEPTAVDGKESYDPLGGVDVRDRHIFTLHHRWRDKTFEPSAASVSASRYNSQTVPSPLYRFTRGVLPCLNQLRPTAVAPHQDTPGSALTARRHCQPRPPGTPYTARTLAMTTTSAVSSSGPEPLPSLLPPARTRDASRDEDAHTRRRTDASFPTVTARRRGSDGGYEAPATTTTVSAFERFVMRKDMEQAAFSARSGAELQRRLAQRTGTVVPIKRALLLRGVPAQHAAHVSPASVARKTAGHAPGNVAVYKELCAAESVAEHRLKRQQEQRLVEYTMQWFETVKTAVEQHSNGLSPLAARLFSVFQPLFERRIEDSAPFFATFRALDDHELLAPEAQFILMRLAVPFNLSHADVARVLEQRAIPVQLLDASYHNWLQELAAMDARRRRRVTKMAPIESVVRINGLMERALRLDVI